MAIRIRHGSAVIEVDSETDLQTVLRVIAPAQPRLIPEGDSINVAGEVHGAGENPHRRMVKGLVSDNQRRFLLALAQAPNGMTDGELRNVLGLNGGAASNSALAGFVTGIVRQAKRAGLTKQQVLTSRKSGRPGARVYHYNLNSAMREAIMQGN